MSSGTSDANNNFSDINLEDLFGNKSRDDYHDIVLSARRVAVLSLIEPAAEASGVNADTMRGMWWVESRSGHPNMLVSPTLAKGDWQFTKATQASIFMHHGPEIAENLDKYGFSAEADNVRMFTRAFRNLAIEKYDMDSDPDINLNGVDLVSSEANELFRDKWLDWGGDILPASNRGFFDNPKSFENYDDGSPIIQGYNLVMPSSEISFLEHLDRTRLDLPATMTFTAAFYLKEIAEDAGVDASDYNNAGALYAGYNIGPHNAARLAGDLSENSNAMGAIGADAYNNPYFFRDNATGEEALANYQSAVEEWRNFRLYDLEPSRNLVEGIARGLRENDDSTINPYDVYDNVIEDRGYYARAETLQAVRENPLQNPFQFTNGINLPFSYSTDITSRFMFDPIPEIDPQQFRLSKDERALLIVDIQTEEEKEFLPTPN